MLFIYDLLHTNTKFMPVFHGLPIDQVVKLPSPRERTSPPTSVTDLSQISSAQESLFAALATLSSHLFQTTPDARIAATSKLSLLCWVVLAERPECIQIWCQTKADIPLCRSVCFYQFISTLMIISGDRNCQCTRRRSRWFAP
jgi:hypothetical protein